MEVLDDFGGDDVGVGKIGAVFEAFVLEPEDVEVEFAPIATASSKQQERRVQAVDGANNPRSTRLL